MLGVISTNAFGGCTSGYCADVYVDQLYIRGSGKNLIQTSGDETKLNCMADSGVFIEIPDTANKKDILSVLLAAQTSGKKVLVRISENPSAACSISYITLNKKTGTDHVLG